MCAACAEIRVTDFQLVTAMSSGSRTVLRQFALLCAVTAISQTTDEINRKGHGDVRGPDAVSGSASGVVPEFMVSSHHYNYVGLVERCRAHSGRPHPNVLDR